MVNLGMNYPERVHVAPVGFEIDRVVLPFLEMKGERIHLITRKIRNERGEKCLKAIREDLEAKGKPYKIHESEQDLFKRIYVCRSIIGEELEQGNHLFVNLSSGGSMQAVACHFAVITFKEGVSAYYAYPEKYNEKMDKVRPGISSGLSKIVAVPHYSIEIPSKEELKVLQIVMRSRIPSKKAILDECVAVGLISSEGKSKPYGHVVLDNRFIRHLEEQDLIMITEKGRKSRVRLTEKGLNTLNISGVV